MRPAPAPPASSLPSRSCRSWRSPASTGEVQRPITHWTAHELADEVVSSGASLPSISVTQVGRYLREAALQPHKKRYWLNTREKDPVVFAERVEAGCNTYQAAQPWRGIRGRTRSVPIR